MDTSSDLLYRYPGTKPFEWNEKNLFKGRDEDIQNLYELISLENLVVLYGRSGLGKTSLLNAGLSNKFTADAAVAPVFIRFFNYYKEKPEKPLDKLYEAFTKEYEQNEQNFIFQKLISPEQVSIYKLWYFFKSLQISKGSVKDTFILIFDQFEELFTYPEKDIAQFKEELSELFFVKVPQQLRNVMKEKMAMDKNYLTKEEMQLIYSPLKIKILFAIRSDKLSLLNNLTDYFPAILKWCYELKPLNSEQAKDAIIKPALLEDKSYASKPFLFTEEAIKLILQALLPDKKVNADKAISEQGIETFQLQIVCRYVENLVIEKGLSLITKEEVSNVKAIFENHYRDIISRFPPEKQIPARRLIEDKLIIDGMRVSMPIPFILKDEGMTPELLSELINTHIIRADQNDTVELSHDTLIEPILKDRINEFSRLKQQGDIFYKQEKYAEAVDVFCQYIEVTKKAPAADLIEVYKMRGDAYAKIKDYQKSNEDYERVLKTNPADISVLYSVALNFFSLNNDSKADEYFVKAAELNPGYSANTYNEAGVTYFTIKEYEQAKIYFEKAIEKDTEFFYPHYNLGLVYSDRNETENALRELNKAVELDPLSVDANNALGNVYYKLLNYTEAKKYYDAAVKIGISRSYVFFNLGNIEVKNQDYEKALEYYQQAINIDKNYLDAYLQKAVMLGLLNRYDDGIACLEEVIKINPKEEGAYLRLGLMYLNKPDLENALKNLLLTISMEPTANAYYYLGLTYVGMNNSEEAVNNFIKAIELDPAYTVAYNQLGIELLILKRYDTVIAGFEGLDPSIMQQTRAYGYLQQAYYYKNNDERSRYYGLKQIESDPKDYDAYLYLAMLEKYAGNAKTSLYYYDEMLKFTSQPAVIHNEIGKILTNEKDYAAATEHLKIAIESDSAMAEPYFNLGNVYYDLNQYENAKKYYEMAVSIDAKYYYSFYNLALAEENIGNLQSAVEYHKKAIEANPEYTKAYLQLSVVLNKLERYDDSIAYLKKAIQLSPSLDAWIDLGNMYLNYKKDDGKAKEYYLLAAEAYPQSDLPYLRLGLAESNLKNNEAAIAAYQKAIAINAQSADAYYEIGNIKINEENFEDAVGYFETAVKLNPDFLSAYNNLGHCYFYINPLKKAEVSFRKAAEGKPDDPYRYMAYSNLAEVLTRLEKYDEALINCQRSIELNPGYDLAYSNAGIASEKMGQMETAVTYFQKALQLNADNKDAKEHLAELEKTRTITTSNF